VNPTKILVEDRDVLERNAPIRRIVVAADHIVSFEHTAKRPIENLPVTGSISEDSALSCRKVEGEHIPGGTT
jgi:hypothetical protein